MEEETVRYNSDLVGEIIIGEAKVLLTCMCLVINFLLESQDTGQVDDSSPRGAGGSHLLPGVIFFHVYVRVFPWPLSAIPNQKELCPILPLHRQTPPTDGMFSSHAVCYHGKRRKLFSAVLWVGEIRFPQKILASHNSSYRSYKTIHAKLFQENVSF